MKRPLLVNLGIVVLVLVAYNARVVLLDAQARPRYVRESVSQVAAGEQVIVLRDELRNVCRSVYVTREHAVSLEAVPCATPQAWTRADAERQYRAHNERNKQLLIQKLKPEDRRVWETPAPARTR